MSLVTLATCSLNQWALDYDGNKDRIIEATRQAKAKNASLLVTPELSIPGYGCLDHFLELDQYEICWHVLWSIINDAACQDIVLDLGMPVQHRSAYYNCRVICHNRRILLIRPKKSLANDGNFREMRYFTPWRKEAGVDEYLEMPEWLQDATGQASVPFGEAIIQAKDCTLAAESCEELFTPAAPHIPLTLAGVDILTNSSGSHHELRKLDTRLHLIREATRKGQGIYLYANQQGCDGDRLYYDGCALIVQNGQIVAQGSQFSLNDVEVVSATLDLERVRSARFAPSRRMQAEEAPEYQRLKLDRRLGHGDQFDPHVAPSPAIEPRIHAPEEEIALGPACWLWDYLRRSQQAGFLVPLSGGIDSCATATIVYSMCREVHKACVEGNQQVLVDVRRVCAQDAAWTPTSPADVCSRLFCTVYMGTEKASSKETRDRARELAKGIGSYHIDTNIDLAVSAFTSILASIFTGRPALRFKVHGGTHAENVALQNIQARIRMVLAYLLAQTVPFYRGRKAPGGLLVLGSGNVDECLRGYLTKYDCSSADLNPIGAISKIDLKKFIHWAETAFGLPILASFLNATPTAELEPITASYTQSDEADMGVTYAELSTFGRLRKVQRLGPWGMFKTLVHEWKDLFTPRQVYEKIRHFHFYYGINRHKMTTMTPSYHAEAYSVDDNRFDLRPFLYPGLGWAYRMIEGVVGRLEEEQEGKKDE